MQLRPYQQILKSEVQEAWAAGHRNVLMRLATGGGKSLILASIAADAAAQAPVVIIAHRQELLAQLGVSLARVGVRHGVIAPDKTRRSIIGRQLEELGHHRFDPSARVTLASIDTLPSRMDPAWAASVGLWIVDECFPAGTPVDGRPIESLRPGDLVTAFNEQTGGFEQRAVVRLFKNKAPRFMVRLETDGACLTCTLGHPVFTRRGWVPAGELTVDDEVLRLGLHELRGANHGNERKPGVSAAQNRPDFLQTGMRLRVSGGDSTAEEGGAIRDPSFSKGPRRERATAHRSQVDACLPSNRTWVRAATGYPNGGSPWAGLPNVLQAGPGEQDPTFSDRGGRGESRLAASAGAGCEERHIPTWTRLDSIAILEWGDPGFSRPHPDDDFVYNIEVEGLHTYVANGIVVHNCHHVTVHNKWGKTLAHFTNARGLGPTATPERGDGLGLGREYDGLMDVMVEGPPERWLIEQAFLTDYRLICADVHLDLTKADIGADGDYKRGRVAEAVKKSSIIGDAPREYLLCCGGTQPGVTFAPNVACAEALAEQYRLAGVPASALYGAQPDRAQVERDFRAGKYKQLVACDIVSEGYDLPAVAVISLCLPTQSLGRYRQQVGRGLRTMPGKTHTWIIDHVGNVLRHGLPDTPRIWTLAGRRTRTSGDGADDAIPLRVCANPTGGRHGTPCLTPYPRVLGACPACGFEPVPASRGAPEHVDGVLRELDPAVLAQMRREAELRMTETPNTEKWAMAGGYPAVSANLKRHAEAREAQVYLRARMADWGGRWHAAGEDDDTIQRRFFLTFGVDVLSAQALGRAEASALAARIEAAV